MSTNHLRAVLFDFDGVLINSMNVMRLAFEASHRDVYGEQDCDFDQLFTVYRRHLGKGFPEIMRALGLSVALHPHFQEHSRYLARYVHLYGGVTTLLDSLSSTGWTMGIATGKDHARTCELLDHLQLRHHFRVVLGCDSVASPKPAPDMVEAFVAQTGVVPEQLVLVGDAPADLECARRARCRSVAALWGFTSAELLRNEQPEFMAESPAQLLAWLQQHREKTA